MDSQPDPKEQEPKPKGCVVDMMGFPIIWFMVMFVGWTAKARISEWLGIRMGGEAVIMLGVGCYLLVSFYSYKRQQRGKTSILSKLMLPMDEDNAIMLAIGGIVFLLSSALVVIKALIH